MSIKYFLILATLLICSCESFKVNGNYQYSQQDNNQTSQNNLTFTHSNNVLKVPVIVTGKVNHDPLFKDKPSYQETSIETWFW